MLACAAAAVWTDGAAADQAETSSFLKLDEGQRYWWLDGAIMTAIHLAAMHDKKRGDCAADWYLDDVKGKQALIEKKIAQYPDMGPTSIVIGLIGRACGSFVDK